MGQSLVFHIPSHFSGKEIEGIINVAIVPLWSHPSDGIEHIMFQNCRGDDPRVSYVELTAVHSGEWGLEASYECVHGGKQFAISDESWRKASRLSKVWESCGMCTLQSSPHKHVGSVGGGTVVLTNLISCAMSCCFLPVTGTMLWTQRIPWKEIWRARW